ncbi:MAG: hypothetical protein AAB444_01005 [Patescibacteria group bacterium]
MRKGQTLLETVVALGIVTSALIGVFTLVVNNLTTERAGSTRMQAVNFAREALEAVRAMRDSNWVAGHDTWEGIATGAEQSLVFYPASGGSSLFPGGEIALYRLSSGLHVQSSAEGVQTQFSRWVNVAKLECSNLPTDAQAACAALDLEKVGSRITAHVRWFEQGRQSEVNLTEDLYDWR